MRFVLDIQFFASKKGVSSTKNGRDSAGRRLGAKKADGEYANGGYTPVPYSAWEREAMGWKEFEVLTESKAAIVMEPLNKGGKVYKFGNGANSEEWFMIDNQQPANHAAKTLGAYRGHGLLAWHIAYSSSTVNMGDYPNNTAGKPRVCLVPADGLVIKGYRFGPGKPYTQAEYIARLKGRGLLSRILNKDVDRV